MAIDFMVANRNYHFLHLMWQILASFTATSVYNLLWEGYLGEFHVHDSAPNPSLDVTPSMLT